MSKRLFLGIRLPDTVKEAALNALPGALRGLKETPFDNLHLTIRFLGNRTAEEEERIIEAMREVAVEAFPLPLEGAGRFPPRGEAKVIWLGVGKGHPKLFQLRQQIDDRLLGLGIDCELRDFLPHVTVARLEGVGTTAIAAYLRSLKAFAGPFFRVKAFCLFESVNTSVGVRYEIAETFPLLDG